MYKKHLVTAPTKHNGKIVRIKKPMYKQVEETKMEEWHRKG